MAQTRPAIEKSTLNGPLQNEVKELLRTYLFLIFTGCQIQPAMKFSLIPCRLSGQPILLPEFEITINISVAVSLTILLEE